MTEHTFPGKLALQQRVLPEYRVPFIEALAAACSGGLSVFAGQPLLEESIAASSALKVARYAPARNWNIFPVRSPLYHCWQSGLMHWLDEWQPDALIVEANSRYPSTRLAIRWMHRRSRPVIGWGLGAPPYSTSGPLSSLVTPWRKLERITLLRS
ncbi:MAG: hypothetical protein EHM70_02645, partial [Chloroflexota bacterium]